MGQASVQIIKHPKVAKVQVTGSDYSGQKVYEQVAWESNLFVLIGGKSCKYCFEAMRNIGRCYRWSFVVVLFAASGQTCIAGSNFLQRSIYDQFLERLIDVASAYRESYAT